jgi:hypothetical protein
MREFVQAAMGFGWTFVAYEISYQDDALTMESTNLRELVQAEHRFSVDLLTRGDEVLDRPRGLDVPDHHDALILSTDNEMVGEPPPSSAVGP